MYSDAELDVAVRDIAVARRLGVDGIVVGSLTSRGEIHEEHMRILIDAAGTLPVTFHRAFETCAPLLGGAIAHDREAYAYLAKSIARFQTREEYEALLRREGFVNVGGEDLTMGVASIVRAEKP